MSKKTVGRVIREIRKNVGERFSHGFSVAKEKFDLYRRKVSTYFKLSYAIMGLLTATKEVLIITETPDKKRSIALVLQPVWKVGRRKVGRIKGWYPIGWGVVEEISKGHITSTHFLFGLYPFLRGLVRALSPRSGFGISVVKNGCLPGAEPRTVKIWLTPSQIERIVIRPINENIFEGQIAERLRERWWMYKRIIRDGLRYILFEQGGKEDVKNMQITLGGDASVHPFSKFQKIEGVKIPGFPGVVIYPPSEESKQSTLPK